MKAGMSDSNNKKLFMKFSLNQMKSSSRALAKVILPKYGKPSQVAYIERGGMIIGRLMCDALLVRDSLGINAKYYLGVDRRASKVNISTIPKASGGKGYILLVDDIADTGKTLKEVLEKMKKSTGTKIVTCTIFYKGRSVIKPDVYMKKVPDNAWVIFEYEENEFKKGA